MPQKFDQDLRPRLRQDLLERLVQRNDQLFWGGVAIAVVGALALLFPVATTFAVAVMVGWILIFAGAATIYGAFSVEGTGLLRRTASRPLEARSGRVSRVSP